MSSEQLPRTRKTVSSQSAQLKVGRPERNGMCVAVGTARNLTKNPITASCRCQADCWPNLRLRQIRERKRNQYYFPDCRYAHAASSSGRFQSAARAASLSNVASWSGETSSSRVTNARVDGLSTTGSRSRKVPSRSMTASMVRSILSSTFIIAEDINAGQRLLQFDDTTIKNRTKWL